jgi:hypothetical protein
MMITTRHAGLDQHKPNKATESYKGPMNPLRLLTELITAMPEAAATPPPTARQAQLVFVNTAPIMILTESMGPDSADGEPADGEPGVRGNDSSGHGGRGGG